MDYPPDWAVRMGQAVLGFLLAGFIMSLLVYCIVYLVTQTLEML